MNAKSLDRIDVHEQRKQLNKLDQEIERALNDLESLNNETKYHNRMLKLKLATNRSTSPVESLSPNNQRAPERPFGFQKDVSNHRSPNNEIQLSPEYLVPRGDNWKELGLLESENKENRDFNMIQAKSPKEFLAIDMGKRFDPREQITKVGAKKGVFHSSMIYEENTSYTANYNNKSSFLQNQADVPKSKRGQFSKPDHFYDLRAKNPNQTRSKSPNTLRVEDRLMQFGKAREERRRALEEAKEHEIRTQASQKLTKARPSQRDLQSKSFVHNRSNSNSKSPSSIKNSPMRELPPLPILGNPQQLNSNHSNDIFYELMKADLEKHAKNLDLQQSFTSPPAEQIEEKGLRDSPFIANNFSTDDKQISFANMKVDTQKSRSKSPLSRKNEDLPEEKSIDKYVNKKYQHVPSRYMGNMNQDKSRSLTPRYDTEESKSTFRPQLSKKSLEMASRMGDAFLRLVDTSIHKSRENKAKLMKELESDLTFKPKINKISEHLDGHFKNNLFNGDQLHRWDQLYLMKDKYKIDIQMKKLEQERKDMESEACTFQPQLNQSTYHLVRESKVNLADRSTQWRERKEKRLNREREANVDKELEGCTFQPDLSKSASRLPNQNSVMNLDNSQISIKGLDQHYERVDLANRKKREKEERLQRNNGDKWKYQITIPQEFNFRLPQNNQDSSFQNISDLSPIRRHSNVALDKSADKLEKQVVWFERNNHSVHPSTTLRDNPNNMASVGHFNEESLQEGFGDAVTRLHYQLYNLDI